MMDQVGLRVEGVVKQLVLVSRNVFKIKNMNFSKLYQVVVLKIVGVVTIFRCS